MSDPERALGPETTHRADGLLVVALAILALLLGCYELFDTDVWWHLRTGRWILEHHRIPRLDIFTFSSADRAWIDLHWGFQVALAMAHALGGVPGMILLSATAASVAVTLAVTARRRDWPSWVVVLCWLPALALMATRFDPRPEVFSLVGLAAFLAVLLRVEDRPAMAWALPIIQVLWVNVHGLFILGPIVLGCYWLDRGARVMSRWAADDSGRETPPLWRHLAPASAAVVLATLVNPYGIRGAMLPLELLPKIADPSNPYKSYIDEFAGLRAAVRDRMLTSPGIHFHIRVQVFLLLMTAWSFLPPAAWRLWRISIERSGRAGAPRSAWWALGLVVPCGLALVAALGLPLPGTPAWLSGIGRAVPVLLLIAGAGGAVFLVVRSRPAAATMGVGAAAAAAWAAWLRADLFDGSDLLGVDGWLLSYAGAGLGLLAAGLILRAGGSLFRMLLAAGFTSLSFQAVRNINLFGPVAGTVLAWNVGEWVAAIAANGPAARGRHIAARPARLMVTALVGVWCVGVVTDRYYPLVGDNIRFGLRERPWTFAHEAARFAGRPGLPDHALVFHLGQAGVYVNHNGPDRKVFMDGRLEVPSLSTFQTYVRIQDRLSRNDPRWDEAVLRLGDPLILIGHEGWAEAEASLLAHPRWRCLYFDEVASVFVPRRGPSSATDFPDFDFAATHFTGAASRPAPMDPPRSAIEADALRRLASLLRRRGGDPWRSTIPMLIRASDRTREWLSGGSADPTSWRLLGLIEWEMTPDLTRPPPGPADPWDPATGLSWARATFCFRRALEAAPGDVPTLKALAASFGVRRMSEARRIVESSLTRRDRPGDVRRLLAEPLPLAVASSWAQADRLAATYMHLGDPYAAGRIWAEAIDPPSPALRSTRMAATDLAALDTASAEGHCRRALEQDRESGEAWYLLSITLFEAGRADEALVACREGLRRKVTPAQRAHLLGIEGILARRHQALPSGREVDPAPH